jgi:HSP20 family protein
VLTIEGERVSAVRGPDTSKMTTHINERFAGRFRRIVSLPDDIDATGVNASYRDGVLRITVPRRESAEPRRIEVQ